MNKNLLNYFLVNKKYNITIFVLILLASLFAQLTPYIQGLIVDTAVYSELEQSLILFCVIFFCIYLLDFICKYFLNQATSNMAFEVSKRIRSEVFKNVIYKPLSFFEKNYFGDVLYRTNTYIYEIAGSLSKDISNLAFGFTTFLTIFVYIFTLNWKIGLVLAGLFVVIFSIIYLFEKKLLNRAEKFKAGELARNSLIMESVVSAETMLSYNRNYDYLKNYKNTSKNYGKARSKYYLTYHIFFPIIDLLVCLGTVFIYFFVYKFSLGIVDIGIVVAILVYCTRLSTPMELIAQSLGNLFEASATVDKVFAYSKTKGSERTAFLVPDKVDIKCEKITYINFEENSKINNVSLDINYGDHILIYGKTGLGKSSFSNLLTGLYSVQKGEILYNNINIEKIEFKTLSKIICLLSDDVGIFDGTILHNIKFFKQDATEKEIKFALKASGFDKVVKKLPNGLNTKISKENISEGDKQLLSFARVILQDPKIVIVDEISRNLDEKIKKSFYQNLEKYTKNKTLIYINQSSNVNLKFSRKINFEKLL